MSRFDRVTGREILLAFKTSNAAVTQAVQVETTTPGFVALAGECPARVAAPGSASITLPPFGYAVCAAETK